MTIENEMKLSFPSKSRNEAFARAAVSAFIMSLDPTVEELSDLLCDPTVEELSDLKTAVSEAVTNCIVHGYRHGGGTIYITARILEGRRVSVKIRDKGCGIEDVPRAMQPLFTNAPEEERAGLGFAVMQSFCDKVRVTSAPGKGTSVTLEKTLSA